MKLTNIIAAAAVLLAAVPVQAVAAAEETEFTLSGAAYTAVLDGDHYILTSVKPLEGTTALRLPSAVNKKPVTAIGERALSGCTQLTEVTIPEGTTTIGAGAFSGCIGLETLTIPDSVTEIGADAFICCASLKTIEVGKGISSLPSGCFFGCASLEEADLPMTLRSISEEAFFGCMKLDAVIPASVEEIGEHAFGYTSDPHSGAIVMDAHFLLKGPAAQKYAEANGMDYIDPKNYTPGDVNGDKSIDAADASETLAEYARASTGTATEFSKLQNIMADMNFDGVVDAADASKILAEYARLSTEGAGA